MQSGFIRSRKKSSRLASNLPIRLDNEEAMLHLASRLFFDKVMLIQRQHEHRGMQYSSNAWQIASMFSRGVFGSENSAFIIKLPSGRESKSTESFTCFFSCSGVLKGKD